MSGFGFALPDPGLAPSSPMTSMPEAAAAPSAAASVPGTAAAGSAARSAAGGVFAAATKVSAASAASALSFSGAPGRAAAAPARPRRFAAAGSDSAEKASQALPDGRELFDGGRGLRVSEGGESGGSVRGVSSRLGAGKVSMLARPSAAVRSSSTPRAPGRAWSVFALAAAPAAMTSRLLADRSASPALAQLAQQLSCLAAQHEGLASVLLAFSAMGLGALIGALVTRGEFEDSSIDGAAIGALAGGMALLVASSYFLSPVFLAYLLAGAATMPFLMRDSGERIDWLLPGALGVAVGAAGYMAFLLLAMAAGALGIPAAAGTNAGLALLGAGVVTALAVKFLNRT